MISWELRHDLSLSRPACHHHLRLSLRRQTGRVTTRKLKSREGFQVRQFAKEHNLGECAAGLFFWSSSDEE